MGIDGLSKLLALRCARVVRTNEIGAYFGRRVAVDASCVIYQFLIAMKRFSESGHGLELTDQHGDVTSHLQGVWYRTIKMISAGIKPIYVFDGAPPEAKSNEIDKRRLRAESAVVQFNAAKEAGDTETMVRMSKRSVRVTREQTEECKHLLRLMGLPVIQAPCEAEAQCAELCKAGKVWGVATEDMDALTFGATVTLRHLSTGGSGGEKGIVLEYHIEEVLQGLGLTQLEFIDLCILLGCDYTSKISGIGPVKAYEGIRQHHTIEALMEALDSKYTADESFDYQSARELFRSPNVIPASDVCIEFCDPDVDGLRKFLVVEKGFAPERVEKGLEKLLAIRTQQTQARLDTYFKVTRTIAPPQPTPAIAKKGAKSCRSGDDTAELPDGKVRKVGMTGKRGVKKT